MSRSAPKVLLIYPPNQLMSVEIPRPDGSLGPLYLAGALKRQGIEVQVLDASVGATGDSLRETFFRRTMQPNGLTRIGMTPQRIKEFISDGKFDVVGINSNFTPQTRMVLEVAKIAKEVNPKMFVIAGGVNARAIPERIFAEGNIDVIALTESEKIIVQLLNSWQNQTTFENIDGLAYLKNGKVVQKPALPNTFYTNLDDLPFPAWELLPLDKYDEVNSPHGSITPGKRRRYAPIMTSRGCPFWCAYCHISEEKNPLSVTGSVGSLRLKSIDRVMQEVTILRSLGVTHLYIEDDSLLAKKARVTELFKKLTGLGMKISNVNGVNLIHFAVPGTDGRLRPDQEYLEIMKSAGFDEIVFPVESGNQRILNKYASGKLNLEQLNVLELVKIAAKVGITCPVNIMMGFPDETEQEMIQSAELAKKLIDSGAPYVTFFIPIPFPGSKLYHMAIAGGHLAPDFDTDSMNWKNPVMKNTVVSPERVLEMRDWAWNKVNTDEYKRNRLEREIGTRFASENQ